MLTEEEKKKCKKFSITARKHHGDDHYSWAVFHGSYPIMQGLSKSEVEYYKRQLIKRLEG